MMRTAHMPVLYLAEEVILRFFTQGDTLHRWGEINSCTPDFTPNTDLWHLHFYFSNYMFASKVTKQKVDSCRKMLLRYM